MLKSSSRAFVYSSSGDNNTLNRNSIFTNSSDSSALYIYSTASNNFSIIDTVFNSSYAGTFEFLIDSSVRRGTWNFTNVTRADGSPITINWSAGANGTLLMNWYLDVYANYTNSSNASGVNVSAWNVNNVLQFNELTDGNGSLARKTLPQYTWTQPYTEISQNNSYESNLWNGLVALYHLNNQSAYGENATRVYDFSGNGNNGTWGNSTTGTINYTTGKLGGAVSFDGVDDYVSVSSMPNHSIYALTAVAWVNIPSTPSSYRIVLSDDNFGANGYRMGLSGSSFYVGLGNGTEQSYTGGTITTNTYKMLAFTYQQPFVTLYIDGNIVVNGTISSNITQSTDSFYIGKTTASNWYFNGTIDEVAIWNRSLSASEVQMLYNKGVGNATYYTPYALNASNGRFGAQNQSVNLTNSTLSIFTFDATLPNATILAPNNSAYLSNATQNFTINLSDNTGLQNATLYIYNSTGGLVDAITTTFTNVAQAILGVVKTLADGIYTFFWQVFDIFGNIFTTGNYTITIDTTYPRINFTSPTPGNNSYINTSYTTINASINELNLANVTYTFNNTNYTISSPKKLLDGLVLMMNFENDSTYGENDTFVYDYSGLCYDNETEILTDNGWKLFEALDKNEKVMTLNQQTGEKEWQLPSERQAFDNKGEMYKIILEDGSELSVSEKHRVYASEENYPSPSKSSISLGERTLTFDCSLSPLSPENIGQLNLSASAIYGASLAFNSNASGSLSRNSEEDMKVICSLTDNKKSVNSLFERCDFNTNLSILFSSSNNMNSGAIKSNSLNNLFTSNIRKQLPFFTNAENTTFTSITSSIYPLFDLSNPLYLFAREIFVSSDNSCASLSINCDLSTMRFSLANSSNSSLSFLATANCQLILLTNASSLSSSGIDIDTSTMQSNNNFKYIKVSNKPTAHQTFEHNDEIYKIKLEDGSEMRVSKKHKVYASKTISNLSSYKIINLPLKSSDFASLSSLEKEVINEAGLSCGILNQTTEKILLDEKCSGLVKPTSLVISTLCSDLDNSANLPLVSPFGLNIASNPSCLRNVSNLFLTFSSKRNLTERDSELDIIPSPHDASRILQCCFDMLGSQRGIIFKNLSDRQAALKHLKDLPDHDSRAFESWLAMANLAICDNIFIDFNSHKLSNNTEVYKDYELMPITEAYSSLQEGKEIYFLNGNNEQVKVKSIEKVPYSGKIYDVDVPNDVVLVRHRNNFNSINKEKEAFDVASKVRHFIPDDSSSNNDSYINFSTDGYSSINGIR
jgi:hypothetical protein